MVTHCDHLVVPAGGYHLARADARHGEINSDTEAVLPLLGAEPIIDDML